MANATMTVERRRVLSAPAERILPLIEDFRCWVDWSPWESMDPDLQRTYAGPDRGVGAVYEWRGNRKVGEGRMEIVRVDADRTVELNLRFIKPFKSENRTVFELNPVDGGTEVTWRMVAPITL